MRCDRQNLANLSETITFQSTHLVWGATCGKTNVLGQALKFQSTHLVWGATPAQCFSAHCFHISIHAPRVRCDIHKIHTKTLITISIHAPRVRCDKNSLKPSTVKLIFQSTHLVWGATKSLMLDYASTDISIHAPRVRCDLMIEKLIAKF